MESLVSRRQILLIFSLLLAVVIGLVVISPGPAQSNTTPRWTPSRVDAPLTTFWAIGDIGKGDKAKPVSDLIDSKGFNYLLYLGDVYDSGTAQEYQDNYDPHFGRFSAKTVPTIGNHEWNNRSTGFDPYWASKRGSAPPRLFVFYASGWQIIVLNSEMDMDPGSEQYQWLEGVLAATPGVGDCRIAFDHHPRYSVGSHGDDTDVEPLYGLLAGKSRAFISGHDHTMQVFNPERGIHQFVSASGGRSPYSINNPSDASISWANNTDEGALRFNLRKLSAPGELNPTNRMAWRFISTEEEILNSGAFNCSRPLPGTYPDPTAPDYSSGDWPEDSWPGSSGAWPEEEWPGDDWPTVEWLAGDPPADDPPADNPPADDPPADDPPADDPPADDPPADDGKSDPDPPVTTKNALRLSKKSANKRMASLKVFCKKSCSVSLRGIGFQKGRKLPFASKKITLQSRQTKVVKLNYSKRLKKLIRKKGKTKIVIKARSRKQAKSLSYRI